MRRDADSARPSRGRTATESLVRKRSDMRVESRVVMGIEHRPLPDCQKNDATGIDIRCRWRNDDTESMPHNSTMRMVCPIPEPIVSGTWESLPMVMSDPPHRA